MSKDHSAFTALLRDLANDTDPAEKISQWSKDNQLIIEDLKYYHLLPKKDEVITWFLIKNWIGKNPYATAQDIICVLKLIDEEQSFIRPAVIEEWCKKENKLLYPYEYDELFSLLPQDQHCEITKIVKKRKDAILTEENLQRLQKVNSKMENPIEEWCNSIQGQEFEDLPEEEYIDFEGGDEAPSEAAQMLYDEISAKVSRLAAENDSQNSSRS